MVADGSRYSTIHSVYAEKDGRKSLPFKYEILQRPTNAREINTVSLAVSGSNIIATLTPVTGVGNEVGVVWVQLTGTLVSNGNINLAGITTASPTNILSASDDGSSLYIQIGKTQPAFAVTIPFTLVAGRTLTVKAGSDTHTTQDTITV